MYFWYVDMYNDYLYAGKYLCGYVTFHIVSSNIVFGRKYISQIYLLLQMFYHVNVNVTFICIW